MAGPLPDLGARDLGGRRILHQVVDRDGPVPVEPRGEILEGDAHVVPEAGLGHRPPGHPDVEQRPRVGGHLGALPLELVRAVPEEPRKRLAGDRDEVRVGHPRSVEAVLGLADLVLPHAGQGRLVDPRIAPAGDEGRHAAERVRAAAVTRLHEELGVGPHERHRHRHLRPVRQHELGPGPELLDQAEHVVPAAGVEPPGVVAQLPQDLVHLERGRQGLDEDGGADRAAREPEPVLGQDERVVPEPRLEMTLELGEVEVGPAPALQETAAVVEDVEPEVEQAPRHGGPVDHAMALDQMPPAGADEQRRHDLVQAIDAPVRVACAGSSARRRRGG